MNMFARLYPSEVVGVVFVDASHPEQLDRLRSASGGAANAIFDAIMLAQQDPEKSEYNALREIREEFAAAPEFPRIPVIVLTAGRRNTMESKQVKEVWLELQSELTGLSPLGSQQIVDSSHYIQRNQPEVVVSAIRSLYDFL